MMSFTIINGYAVLSLILAANVSLDVLIITSGLPSLSFLSLAFFLPESPGINIYHENQNYSEADPENFKTFSYKKIQKANYSEFS